LRRVAIAGATSAIAQEAARCFARDGASLFLAARDPEKLSAVADDLRARGAAQVETQRVDLADLERCRALPAEALARLGALDVLLVAHGTLPDQAACERDPEQALREISLNGLSAIALAASAASLFESQGSGCIAVITSVAGVRGRRSNHVYGAAKAAVSTYLEGLRGRMLEFGVPVVDIRPGFVDTPMTADIEKNRLFASAQSVGQRVYRAIGAGEGVVYTPWFWRWIMLVIRLIPGRIFSRLRF